MTAVVAPWLVFLDIDGTLVDDSHRPRESAIAAVRGARQRGHRVYLSTGRSRTGISEEIMAIGFDGVVSASGGFIEEAGELVVVETMPQADVAYLIDIFRCFDLEYTLQTNGRSYASRGLSTRMGPLLEGQRRMAAGGASALAHIDQLERRFLYDGPPPLTGIAKASFVGVDTEVFYRFRDALDPRFLAVTGTIPYLGEQGGEVGLRCINKGQALQIVADRWGIPLAHTMAVGDSANDYEMVAAAGVGVAMGGSPESLVSVADIVTGTVREDGIWNAFARHGLIPSSGLAL